MSTNADGRANMSGHEGRPRNRESPANSLLSNTCQHEPSRQTLMGSLCATGGPDRPWSLGIRPLGGRDGNRDGNLPGAIPPHRPAECSALPSAISFSDALFGPIPIETGGAGRTRINRASALGFVVNASGVNPSKGKSTTRRLSGQQRAESALPRLALSRSLWEKDVGRPAQEHP